MSQSDDELAPIDPDLLDAVMGGTATNEQINEALNHIKSSLDNLKSSNGNNTNWMQWFIPLLLIARGGSNFSYSGGGFTVSGHENPWGAYGPPPGGGRHRRGRW